MDIRYSCNQRDFKRYTTDDPWRIHINTRSPSTI